MPLYRLTYITPNAARTNPPTPWMAGRRQEVIEFKSRNNKTAIKWANDFCGEEIVEIRSILHSGLDKVRVREPVELIQVVGVPV